jgi:hypothetical protein
MSNQASSKTQSGTKATFVHPLSRQIQHSEQSLSPGHAAPPIVHEALQSTSQPLDSQTREFMGARFDYDFSRVRIHSDSKAARSAQTLNAQAYTVGTDIVFGANRYNPGDFRGEQLLAHELAHVVQQDGMTRNEPGQLKIGEPSTGAERAADQAISAGPSEIRRGSTALDIRRRLRDSRLTNPTVQRAVTTWAGEWDTDHYRTLNTAGVRDGVDIKLRFKPGPLVDATTIGIVQMANSRDLGAALALDATVGARSIPAGGRGEGAHIDQLAANRNPLYAVDATPAADTSLTDTAPVTAGGTHGHGWGRHGHRFTDKAGNLHTKDAWMDDTPQLPGHGANASQIFETAALAITGAQRGTYYGTVRWGWRTNAAGKFHKLPLSKVSDDVPSRIFARAARIWGTTTTSTGAPVLGLPVAGGRFTNADNVLLVTDPSNPAGTTVGTLAKNARVEVIDLGLGRGFNKGPSATRWWKVTAVDGIHVGRVGWVMSSSLATKKS